MSTWSCISNVIRNETKTIACDAMASLLAVYELTRGESLEVGEENCVIHPQVC